MTITIDYGMDSELETIENVYQIAPRIWHDNFSDGIHILFVKDGRHETRFISYTDYVRIVIH